MKNRLYLLMLVCLIPLTVIIVYLMVLMNRFSLRYDGIVENITAANAYNIKFKEDLDYSMYIIVANSERAEELIGTSQPGAMIEKARETFQGLYDAADSDYAKSGLNRILRCLDTLNDRADEIIQDSQISGTYVKNMERLDMDIRILTELIQEQIQEYIYYETTNLEVLREGIRADVDRVIRIMTVVIAAILVGALLLSRKVMAGITGPIGRLCQMTRKAASGDFGVRAQEGGIEELSVLNESFNRMVAQLGDLVEGIKTEQRNLRATELKLLQAQINPHFLYNTLDAIIWLAESGQKEQVVSMVSALSDFFRTTLSKGRDYISVQEEEAHIRSYLQIQQFRYQDILEYDIQIPRELYGYQVLKLTLQPLVENALYHGIKNKRGLGHILVTGRKEGERLFFTVRDDGIGMEEEQLRSVRRIIAGEGTQESDSSGFGLFNVQQRLQLNYGAEYGIRIESVYGSGTRVTVEMPALLDTAANDVLSDHTVSEVAGFRAAVPGGA